jgi:hypothetical protein
VGHFRQLVALPATSGFLALRNWLSVPLLAKVLGRCGGSDDPGAGEHSIQRMKSMSWQDLVRREGADVSDRRQLPL